MTEHQFIFPIFFFVQKFFVVKRSLILPNLKQKAK
jgi:hypothetical protein